MAKTKVTSKGQVTIPKRIRVEFDIREGDELDFVADNGFLRVRKIVPESPFAEYRGYLKHLAGKRTDDLIEEMRGR